MTYDANIGIYSLQSLRPEEKTDRVPQVDEGGSRGIQSGGYQNGKDCRQESERNPFEQIAYASITGLREREYEAILAAQDGRCAVCRKKANDRPASFRNCLIPDLDQRGVVRGLLCPACHAALNLLHQDPDLIQCLANYATKGSAVRIRSKQTSREDDDNPAVCGEGFDPFLSEYESSSRDT